MKNWDENLGWYNFMFMKNSFIMEKIVRTNGYVYLVKEHDVYGRHTTLTNLGKDPNHPMWAEELNNIKANKKKNKKETE